MRRMLTDADIAKLSSGVEWALDEPEKIGTSFKNVRYGIYQISVGGYQGDSKLVAFCKSQSTIETSLIPSNPGGTLGNAVLIDFNPSNSIEATSQITLKPICYFE